MDTDKRYLTRDEINERLARHAWHRRPVPMGWFLAVTILGILGVLWSIGLTLHEAGGNPPFEGMYEYLHGLFGEEPMSSGH